jgi:PncC family amidohydrolase
LEHVWTKDNGRRKRLSNTRIIWGTGDIQGGNGMAESLQTSVGQALKARGWTLSLAESCTGGLIGHLLTEVPGASEYFLGGVICYSDRIKMEQLGVAKATLVRDGAVSEETARQMALGARARLGASFGLAVTGIAGPDGGSEAKPVGTTWIAVASPDGEQAAHFHFDGDRTSIKQQAAEQALRFLLAEVKAAGG